MLILTEVRSSSNLGSVTCAMFVSLSKGKCKRNHYLCPKDSFGFIALKWILPFIFVFAYYFEN